MEKQQEVANIFRVYGQAYRDAHGMEMPKRHFRTINAIESCRTAELGGHVDKCEECGVLKISYNSCRNRHCPKCQCLDKERWLKDRKRDVLPTSYYHVVFTIPEELRPLALRNQKVVYGILFQAASDTLKELAKDPKHLGAEIGFIAVLHTWSQTLIDHPHIHCIVTGGGLSQDGKKWVSGKKQFFIHYKVLSRVFRGKFLDYLRKKHESGELVFPGKIKELNTVSSFNLMLSNVYNKEWIVYCKEPFQKPEHVIDYLGRYTHRVAISNDRIIKLEEGKVTVRYRDSSDNDKTKLMSLDAFEFIRRFLLHVLPDNFMKIRHYGILSNRNRKTKLSLCKELLEVVIEDDTCSIEAETWEDLLTRITGVDPRICTACGKGKMVRKEMLVPKRGRYPP